MSDFQPVLLANIGNDDSHTLRGYEETGGYRSLKRAMAEMQPTEVIELVKASGLRGRGGAGFPTGLKWTFLPEDHPGPVYFCLNADESEPGTFNNRILMEDDPHQVLEGLILSCYATGASTAYYYIRYEYPLALKRCQAAIDECYAAGYLGENILGSGFSLDVFMHRGAAAYICGEETALLESLEGKKGQPRYKPPFPANFGLYGKPTTINNTESLASAPAIIRNGAQWFADLGIPNNGGVKCFSMSGHLNKPGNFEISMGTPFKDLLEMAGGVRDGRKLKAVIPGGSSVPILTADMMMECNMDYDSISKAGSMLGSGAVIVMDETTDMVRALRRISRFYYSESCGQCTPCREGTGWLYRVLTRIVDGKGRPEDIDQLEEVSHKIEGRTICALGDAAAMPVWSFIKHFRHEFEYYIEHKRSIVDNAA